MERPIELKDRCQSCGMPLATGAPADKGFMGTAADGSVVTEYCRFCYAAGAFLEPTLTLEGMIDKSVGHMVRVLRMPQEKAKEIARATIPRLKRWESRMP